MKSLPSDGWQKASCGEGTKGSRIYEWQTVEIAMDWREIVKREETDEWKRVLLVRRSVSDATDMQGHMCYAPADTTDDELRQVAGTRWTVEQCFEEAKGEVGMDHYECRSYDGWYRHITFACVALALLTAVSVASGDHLPLQSHDPMTCSLDDFKKKRGLLV